MPSSQTHPQWCQGNVHGTGRGSNKVLLFIEFPTYATKTLAKNLGLTELKKSYVPNFFNHKENQTYIGPLPAVVDYDPDNISAKERQEFLTGYNQLKNEDFLLDLEKEIEEYCCSDGAHSQTMLSQVQRINGKTCRLDLFKYCVTIVSACNQVLSQQFL